MAQLSQIVLNNGTANVTFVPYEIDANSVARLRTAAPTSIEALELSVQGRDAVANRRVTVKITVPTVQTETVNGISVPKVVRKQIGSMELSLPKTSLTADRVVLRSLLASALQNALIAAVIDNNESLY